MPARRSPDVGCDEGAWWRVEVTQDEDTRRQLIVNGVWLGDATRIGFALSIPRYMLTDEYPMEFAASDHHISITAPLAMICGDDEEARAEAAARHLIDADYQQYDLTVKYRDVGDETNIVLEPIGMCSSVGDGGEGDGKYFTEPSALHAFERRGRIHIESESGYVTVCCWG